MDLKFSRLKFKSQFVNLDQNWFSYLEEYNLLQKVLEQAEQAVCYNQQLHGTTTICSTKETGTLSAPMDLKFCVYVWNKKKTAIFWNPSFLSNCIILVTKRYSLFWYIPFCDKCIV